MQINDAEFQLILAALRTTALQYERMADEADKAGRRDEARRLGAFFIACAELSNRLEQQHPRRANPFNRKAN